MEGITNQKMGSRRAELIAPCKDCRERHPGCHDHCERYAAFKDRREAARAYEERHKSAGEIYDPLVPVRRQYQ